MIVADGKDWTWVLRSPCPECGFDASTCRAADVPYLIRQNAQRWQRLEAAGAIRPGRPDPTTWSTLEYACHVRDVYHRYFQRITLMTAEDDPLFPNWDQDASAIDDRYEQQRPGVVVAQLGAAAEMIARLLETMPDDGWQRPGRRGDGASFTIESIARYMIHDPIHHVWDVSRLRFGDVPH